MSNAATKRDVLGLARLRAMLRSGEAVKIREAAEITNPEMATALGVNPSTLYRWETGKCVPKGEKAKAYARLLAELIAQRTSAAAL